MASFIVTIFLMTKSSAPRITTQLLCEDFVVEPWCLKPGLCVPVQTDTDASSALLLKVSTSNSTSDITTISAFSQRLRLILQQLEVPYYGATIEASPHSITESAQVLQGYLPKLPDTLSPGPYR